MLFFYGGHETSILLRATARVPSPWPLPQGEGRIEISSAHIVGDRRRAGGAEYLRVGALLEEVDLGGELVAGLGAHGEALGLLGHGEPVDGGVAIAVVRRDVAEADGDKDRI